MTENVTDIALLKKERDALKEINDIYESLIKAIEEKFGSVDTIIDNYEKQRKIIDQIYDLCKESLVIVQDVKLARNIINIIDKDNSNSIFYNKV